MSAQEKLIEVPRIAIDVDQSDPNVLKLAFSGSLELGRADAGDVAFYNSLEAGEQATLKVRVHVAGTRTRHRRDNEGEVDAIVQTKSLIVDLVEQ